MKSFIFAFAVAVSVVFTYLAFGQVPPSPVPTYTYVPAVITEFVPPVWFALVLTYIKSVPVVGPIALIVLQWLGVVASVCTALATAFFVIMQSLTKILKAAKLVELAVKVEAIYVKVSPILQYLSIYNVQKKEKA